MYNEEMDVAGELTWEGSSRDKEGNDRHDVVAHHSVQDLPQSELIIISAVPTRQPFCTCKS